MALAKCLECGKEVSRSAKTCPNCGKPDPTVSELAKSKKKEKDMDAIWGIVPIIIFGSIILKSCDII